jgi:hypothetical protein
LILFQIGSTFALVSILNSGKNDSKDLFTFPSGLRVQVDLNPNQSFRFEGNDLLSAEWYNSENKEWNKFSIPKAITGEIVTPNTKYELNTWRYSLSENMNKIWYREHFHALIGQPLSKDTKPVVKYDIDKYPGTGCPLGYYYKCCDNEKDETCHYCYPPDAGIPDESLVKNSYDKCHNQCGQYGNSKCKPAENPNFVCNNINKPYLCCIEGKCNTEKCYASEKECQNNCGNGYCFNRSISKVMKEYRTRFTSEHRT